MPAIPSGTVTFVFTDIEGSTQLLKRLGDRYAELLGQHRRLLRATFAEHDGQEIDTQGDAFFYSFARARQAVAAAVQAQRAHDEASWPDDVVLRVRMGLHTGEPLVGEEGYTGLDVVRAARIAGSGKGGQILLSETTRALVGANVPDGVQVRDLGAHRLKDLDEPESMYELVMPGRIGSTGIAETDDPPARQVARPHRSWRDIGTDALRTGFLEDFTTTLREELSRHALDRGGISTEPADQSATSRNPADRGFGSELGRRILEDVQRSIEDSRDERSRRETSDPS